LTWQAIWKNHEETKELRKELRPFTSFRVTGKIIFSIL